jgi:sulfonate transport system ATP-binding protein
MNESSVELGSVEAATRAAGKRRVGVEIEALSKRYGEREVLTRLALDVPAAQFVAIVGRSGCGKSTLLRLVARLETPTSGRLSFCGGATGNVPDIRIMFQDARLLPWKRVLDNVALGLPRQRLDAARRALDQVGLGQRTQDWPALLSGGQRQRVALARALVHEPSLLLLDEPLGALDALTRIEMQQLIESLWRDRGFTGLLVTHDVDEAVVLADRVVLIEDGRIVFDVPVDLPRPRQRGSASFAALVDRVLRRVLRQPEQTAASLAPVQRERSLHSGMFDRRLTC